VGIFLIKRGASGKHRAAAFFDRLRSEEALGGQAVSWKLRSVHAMQERERTRGRSRA
jgi:hypothetical protein